MKRHCASWIAALAMLLAGLAPAVSQALTSMRGATWIEVCTALGSTWRQTEPAAPGEQAPPKHLLDRCLYCSVHAPDLLVPPAPATVAPVLSLGHDAPEAFASATLPRHAWLNARPRAPPLDS